MYVDESGNCGLSDKETRYLVLTGLVIHELRWHPYLEELIRFRRFLKHKYGLRQDEEFHTSRFINKTPIRLLRIPRRSRWAMIQEFTDLLATMTDFNVINIVVDKSDKPPDYDVFEKAWRTLIQRFENTIAHHNFSGPRNPDERGLILPDHTDDKKLQRLLRRMRRFNPIPNIPEWGPGYRDLQLQYIVEDPNFRDSFDSYFIQATDLCAFLLYQNLDPNRYMVRDNRKDCFYKLEPILCKFTSRDDQHGIVRL